MRKTAHKNAQLSPRLLLVVDQPAGLVAEYNVDLLPVKHRRHFAMAEDIVHHYLASPIFSIAVIGRSNTARTDRDRGFYAAHERTSRRAHIADHF